MGLGALVAITGQSFTFIECKAVLGRAGDIHMVSSMGFKATGKLLVCIILCLSSPKSSGLENHLQGNPCAAAGCSVLDHRFSSRKKNKDLATPPFFANVGQF